MIVILFLIRHIVFLQNQLFFPVLVEAQRETNERETNVRGPRRGLDSPGSAYRSGFASKEIVVVVADLCPYQGALRWVAMAIMMWQFPTMYPL